MTKIPYGFYGTYEDEESKEMRDIWFEAITDTIDGFVIRDLYDGIIETYVKRQ